MAGVHARCLLYSSVYSGCVFLVQAISSLPNSPWKTLRSYTQAHLLSHIHNLLRCLDRQPSIPVPLSPLSPLSRCAVYLVGQNEIHKPWGSPAQSRILQQGRWSALVSGLALIIEGCHQLPTSHGNLLNTPTTSQLNYSAPLTVYYKSCVHLPSTTAEYCIIFPLQLTPDLNLLLLLYPSGLSAGSEDMLNRWIPAFFFQFVWWYFGCFRR